ncbi:hypothetical protein DFO54_1076 [Erwinia sp. AG740]|nr:hypothetical protein DFO54_1076 [Erwinia sp. AG740]
MPQDMAGRVPTLSLPLEWVFSLTNQHDEAGLSGAVFPRAGMPFFITRRDIWHSNMR